MWELRICYPNGQEKPLRVYHDREAALKQIATIYAKGYPMHVAYVVRPVARPAASPNPPREPEVNDAQWLDARVWMVSYCS